ncbi:MAG TPA: 4-(cytidine 5'-diphospho)-2-C-methyl-D-erythritol kinase [Candidatus Binatia bacterium]|nr:4-(cytidine 5'-diphospho)-2-C-methyl-D-erythritol kinase [Candidatus Binatia bacterium]
MRIRAPAKVNLFLRVLGRRQDGYHLIDTVIVPVSLYDDIEITRSKHQGPREDDVTLSCDHPLVPSGKKNLAYQAASLLLREKKISAAIHIHIRKRIPVGGGLGGGSSDAAATLLGLSRLLRLGSHRKELSSLAVSLGADVPFFIQGRPAEALGIGEILKPIRSLPRLWIIILYPRFPISTRWAYENLKLTKDIENTSINFSLRDPQKIKRVLFNDLEKVTLRRYPEIALLKERLVQEGAVGALMSGSGSSVFGVFSGLQNARRAFHHLRMEEGCETFLVRSLS